MAMYNWRVSPMYAEKLYWGVFVVEVAYCICFYTVGAFALWSKDPKYYTLLANLGVAGIFGFVLLAYLDKFNLVSFFMRLITYIYARFLQGLTATMFILNPGAGNAGGALDEPP